jgi:N-acetyl-beta-hexosaminidase
MKCVESVVGVPLFKYFIPRGALCFCVAVLLWAAWARGEVITLSSPDGRVQVGLYSGEQLSYSVNFQGLRVVEPSALGLSVDGLDLGRNARMVGADQRGEVNERYLTRGVHTNAVNHYRHITVPLASGPGKTPWLLELRAYDDGVAYRYRVPGQGARHIDGESSEWQIPTDTRIWHQSDKNRSYEARYVTDLVGNMPDGCRLMAPAALQFAAGGGYGLLTEANLADYSDMALRHSGSNSFKAFFHNSTNGWDAQGEILSPWRVTVLASNLNTLVNSDLIHNLCPAPAPKLASADWIKPGRAVWHWLVGRGPKLPEQHAWVDATSRLGYEYYLVDDGWRNWEGGGGRAWAAMTELVQYARGRKVAIWAWVNSKYVFKAEDRKAYFARAKRAGIVGLKIDFPKPAEPQWVRWYDETLRDAASAKLMVDFHGAIKPTGRDRTWPNEMTREAVAGREQGKNPSLHDTTLPFLRYVQGHADFTPTLLIPGRLRGSSFAHELAMSVLFTSPFLCLADHPTNYLNSAACDILKAMPAVWDETLVLPGSEIGRQAAFARRRGEQWFVAVLNDQTPREGRVSLSFLKPGHYRLVECADVPDRNDALARAERTVTRDDSLTPPLRGDGGYLAWLVPVAAGESAVLPDVPPGVREPSIVPVPRKMTRLDGAFELGPETRIYADKASERTAAMLASWLRPATGLRLRIQAHSGADSAPRNGILLTTANAGAEVGAEGYTLNATTNGVVIRAATQAGLFYGAQSLRQLLPAEILSPKPVAGVAWSMPAVEIADAPRFHWRGVLLDVSRHFFTKEEVKRVVDLMALYKMNVFHWHLVDHEGWRIESKKYPRLTEVGAWTESIGYGLDPSASTAWDKRGRYGGFYTQREIKEVVAYAAERHITVMPEIELPGHSTAALRAYPEYLCPGARASTNRNGGGGKGVYCAGNEASFAFLSHVLAEVAPLFPGKYLHIGGDEVSKKNWSQCALCQARMKAEGLKDERELQSYFIRRIETNVNALGKTLVGWSEIREGGLATGATLMDWKGGGLEAAATGHEVVMASSRHCYLDCYQSTNSTEPPAHNRLVPLQKVYGYDPVPTNLPSAFHGNILGVQASLWAEHIANLRHAEYMLFPRLGAVSELAWSPPSCRDWAQFKARAAYNERRLDALGVNYRIMDEP